MIGAAALPYVTPVMRRLWTGCIEFDRQSILWNSRTGLFNSTYRYFLGMSALIATLENLGFWVFDTMVREILTARNVLFVFGKVLHVAKFDEFLYECKGFRFQFRIGI